LFGQAKSITRGFRAAAAAAALVACAAGPNRIAASVQGGPAGGASAAPWRPATEYAQLFAPAAYGEAYQFFTSPRGIDELLAQIERDPASVRSPGAWTPRPLGPFDAFGQGGAYDRTKLARLYGSRRARVARGPRQEGGTVVESWTLISPYPDRALRQLEPGTLLVVLRLP
jgi:hypothetical protein